MAFGIVLIILGIIAVIFGFVIIWKEDDAFSLVMLVEILGILLLICGIGICDSVEAQSIPQNSIYCVQCGDSVEENYIYCPDCGTKIVHPE